MASIKTLIPSKQFLLVYCINGCLLLFINKLLWNLVVCSVAIMAIIMKEFVKKKYAVKWRTFYLSMIFLLKRPS